MTPEQAAALAALQAASAATTAVATTVSGAVAQMAVALDSEPPPEPPYTVTATPSPVSEGGTVTFTVSGPAGAVVAYMLEGITSADVSVPLVGTLTLDAAGVGTLVVGVAADALTEGAETITCRVNAVVAQVAVDVVDSSVAPPPPPTPTYTLSADPSSLDEGQAVAYVLRTEHVPAGTALPYRLLGVQPADISVSLTGTLAIGTDGTARLEVLTLADRATEGDEIMRLEVDTSAGTISASAVIRDTSAAPPPSGAKTWVALTVAPHSRVVTGISGRGANYVAGTFRSTRAAALDVQAPVTVSAIPYRSFCSPVPGEPGIVYYHGSLHSNYPGNEIDRIDLRDLASTTITTTLSHQPRIPPDWDGGGQDGKGDGYDAGSGSFVYPMYGPAPVDPQAVWQPYAHHTWTKSSWHPTWGLVMQCAGAKLTGTGPDPVGNGSGYPRPTDGQALVSYDFAEGRYRLRVDSRLSPVTGRYEPPGMSGASDWNQHTLSMVFMQNIAGYTYVRELVGESSTVNDLFYFNQATLSGNTWGFADNASGNGLLVRHLEGTKYLCLRADFNRYPGDPVTFGLFNTLFLLRLKTDLEPTHSVTRLVPPADKVADCNPHGDGNVSFCIDKNSRRIFWLVYRNLPTPGAPQFVRFYVSTFDAPMVWTEIVTTGLPTIVHQAYEAGWLGGVRAPMWFYNGHLFLIPPGTGTYPSNPGYCNGAVQLWRVKVDDGAPLP